MRAVWYIYRGENDPFPHSAISSTSYNVIRSCRSTTHENRKYILEMLDNFFFLLSEMKNERCMYNIFRKSWGIHNIAVYGAEKHLGVSRMIVYGIFFRFLVALFLCSAHLLERLAIP